MYWDEKLPYLLGVFTVKIQARAPWEPQSSRLSCILNFSFIKATIIHNSLQLHVLSRFTSVIGFICAGKCTSNCARYGGEFWRRNFPWVLAYMYRTCWWGELLQGHTELWTLNWLVSSRLAAEELWPGQQSQNWSHNDQEFDLSVLWWKGGLELHTSYICFSY